MTATFVKRLKYVRTTIIEAMRRRWHRAAYRSILSDVGDAEAARWAIFCIRTHNLYVNLPPALVARELVSKGWHVKWVYSGTWFDHIAYKDDTIAHSLSAPADQYSTRLTGRDDEETRWDIDLPGKIIEAEGCNFFSLIEAQISRLFQVYSVDLTQPEYKNELENALSSVKAVLQVAKRIRRAAEGGKRITIVMERPFYLPNGALFVFFNRLNFRQNVDMYFYGGVSSMYYTNRSLPHVTMIKAAIPEAEDQNWVIGKDFRAWFDRLSNDAHAEIARTVKPWMDSDYHRKIGHTERNDEIENRVMQARDTARPIYCLMTNSMQEKQVRDSTSIFTDMLDWVRRTVEAFHHLEGTLLIKTHGLDAATGDHEIFSSKMRIEDVLAGVNIPDNVIILPSNQYIASELRTFIDAAIIWRSTAYLEMVFHDIPSLYTGVPAYYSDALSLRGPASFEDYVNKLRRLPTEKPDRNLASRAAAVLYYNYREKIFPVHQITKLPEWLFGPNNYIDPFQLRKALRTGVHDFTVMSDAIDQRQSSVLGPSARQLFAENQNSKV